MPKTAAPDNATPAKAEAVGAEAADVGGLADLVAFVAAKEAGQPGNDSDKEPAAAESESVPSQNESASDGAGEAEGEAAELSAANPEATEATAEASKATEAKELEGDDPDALEEWLATLPKSAARKLRAQHRQLGELKRELSDLKAKQPDGSTTQPASAKGELDSQLATVTDERELNRIEAEAQVKLDRKSTRLNSSH